MFTYYKGRAGAVRSMLKKYLFMFAKSPTAALSLCFVLADYIRKIKKKIMQQNLLQNFKYTFLCDETIIRNLFFFLPSLIKKKSI